MTVTVREPWLSRDVNTGKRVAIANCPDMQQPRASLTDGVMGHLGKAVVQSDGLTVIFARLSGVLRAF
jgi:hypothetical protein